jgi:glycogen synthase
VLGDIPSLRELWDGAAVFVDPDDHGALADALDRLATAPAQREQLAREATVRAGRYGVDVMAAAYAAAYRQVVERAGAHA